MAKKKVAKKTDEAAPQPTCQIMIVTNGCFVAQADFSEFPDPYFLGILTENGDIINENDARFDDVVLKKISYF